MIRIGNIVLTAVHGPILEAKVIDRNRIAEDTLLVFDLEITDENWTRGDIVRGVSPDLIFDLWSEAATYCEEQADLWCERAQRCEEREQQIEEYDSQSHERFLEEQAEAHQLDHQAA